MSPTLDAVLRSWPLDPWLTAALLLGGGVYLRGFALLRRRNPLRWPLARGAAFGGALAAVYLALASPIEPLAGFLLSVHMLQHLLLMMVVPPLVWLAAPLLPLYAGLPAEMRVYWARPLLQSRRLRRAARWLSHPGQALAVFVAVTWIWHIPAIYDAALRCGLLHYCQHACFLAAALLFWYPVVRPYPARSSASAGWSAWLLVPYLIVADVQNTLLSAVLTFARRPLYDFYSDVPRLGGLSALEDQHIAGVLMWVPGSVAFLLPLGWIGVRLLYGQPAARARAAKQVTLGAKALPLQVARAFATLPVLAEPAPEGRQSLRRRPSSQVDILRTPLLGALLRWRHTRRLLQIALLLLAALMIYDGLAGPQVTALNLAGVLPWIHWRGLLILGLLVAGNFFCFACPFTLVRSLGRRLLPAGRAWPRPLRSKWLAVFLLLAFLWAYEAFSLWDSPWITAWIAVAYFVAALLIDGLFAGAAFCKYVCPIGQFNFVQSLVSPLSVAVREPAICASCRTHECLRGTADLPGCELALLQPRKQGNMDCTFCLDCVQACPHDNVGLIAGLPGRSLWTDRARSGVGRFSRRADLAALVVVLVFGAMANAGGMVGPVVTWQDALQARLGWQSPLGVVSLTYACALIVAPLVLVGACAALARRWTGSDEPVSRVATRYVYMLVPLGFAVWVAHYSFHFFTSCSSIVPVLARLSADHDFAWIAAATWQADCCRPPAAWLPRAEILMLDAGLLVSLYTGYRIAVGQFARSRRAVKALAPWAALCVLLFVCGVWIVLQPMQMRGTLESRTMQVAEVPR